MKTPQNLLGVALVILQIKRGAQAIGSDNSCMIRKCGLHQGHEAGVTALARGHLLAHHPGVAVAEKKDEPAAGHPVRTQFRRFLNYVCLRALQLLKQVHGMVIERRACLLAGGDSGVGGWITHG